MTPGLRVVQVLDTLVFLVGAGLLLSGRSTALGLAAMLLSVAVTLGVQVVLNRDTGRG